MSKVNAQQTSSTPIPPETNSQSEQLSPIEEVAFRLHIHPAIILEMTHRKSRNGSSMPAVRVGGVLWFRWSEVSQWIKELKQMKSKEQLQDFQDLLKEATLFDQTADSLTADYLDYSVCDEDKALECADFLQDRAELRATQAYSSLLVDEFPQLSTVN